MIEFDWWVKIFHALHIENVDKFSEITVNMNDTINKLPLNSQREGDLQVNGQRSERPESDQDGKDLVARNIAHSANYIP